METCIDNPKPFHFIILGKFNSMLFEICIKDKKDRRGRNPATGEDLTLEARRVVVFKCSGVLREKVNGKG